MKNLSLILTVVGITFAMGSQQAIAGATKNFLMAVHGCDTAIYGTSCTQPNYHTTHVMESDDGVSWSAVPGFPTWTSSSSISASVPDLIRRQNFVYVFNPGYVTRIRRGTGVVEDVSAVSILDSSGVAVEFVDPSPYLDRTTGLIILFYLESTGISGDPAGCPDTDSNGDPNYPCYKNFNSATEVAGSYGTSFVEDAGHRVTIEINDPDPVSPSASDPDIFEDPSGYVLFVSRGPNVQAFTSTTLQGSYSAIAALPDGVLVAGSGIPSGHYDSVNGNYWIYTHDMNLPSVIRQAVVPNLNTKLFNTDFSTVATGGAVGEDPMTYLLASPGFCENTP